MPKQTLEQLKARKQIAEEALETHALESQLALLEPDARAVQEGFSPFPSNIRTDNFNTSDPAGHTIHGRAFIETRIDDTEGGKFFPYFENETDLSLLRATARGLSYFSDVGIGALQALKNYTIGTGFQYTAEKTERAIDDQRTANAIAITQDIIDQFIQDNNFVSEQVNPFEGSVSESMDREIHGRDRTDGEVFIVLHNHNGRAKATILEPDMITEPANPRELEEFIQFTEVESFWEFGVHTMRDSHMGFEDVSRPIGYHAVYNSAGTDWDYIPARRMTHMKRNVPAKVKRGISDFIGIHELMARNAKLERNTATGAAIHAAIVGIISHVPGADKSQISGFAARQRGFDIDRPNDQSTQSVRHAVMDQPHFKSVPDGMTYEAGAQGQLRSNMFIEVAAFLRRAIGTRWAMPENIISGDASNSAFASLLVAEAPFVKARVADQAYFKRGFATIFWKAIRIAWEHGAYGDGITFKELSRIVQIKIDAPDPASRDIAAKIQSDQILNTMGIKSKRTIAGENNLDFDVEQQNIESEPIVGDSDSGSMGAVGSLSPTLESLIEDRLTSEESSKSREVARQMRFDYP